MLGEEGLDSFVLPLGAAIGPLNENLGSNFEGMFGNDLER